MMRIKAAVVRPVSAPHRNPASCIIRKIVQALQCVRGDQEFVMLTSLPHGRGVRLDLYRRRAQAQSPRARSATVSAPARRSSEIA